MLKKLDEEELLKEVYNTASKQCNGDQKCIKNKLFTLEFDSLEVLVEAMKEMAIKKCPELFFPDGIENEEQCHILIYRLILLYIIEQLNS
jgi:hypothetical protein